MNYSSAIIFNGKDNPLEEKSFPLIENPEKNEVLVEITLATICGSDVHTWLGHRPFPTPCILGHEIVGKITKLGENVKHDFSGGTLNIGDRIVWSMTVGCDDCFFCKNSIPQKCVNLFKYGHERSDASPFLNGGLSKYIILKKNTAIFKIPDNLTDEEVSPLMCAGACVLNGLDLANFSECDYFIVQGCGALGIYACAFGKELGAKNIIAIDKIQSRLDVAKEFGANYTILYDNQTQIVEEIKKITKGKKADYVIEVTGDPTVIDLGIKSLRVGGKYILLGALYPNSKFTIDSSEIIRNVIQLIGLHNYSPEYLGKSIELVSNTNSKYPYHKIVGPIFDLSASDVEKAFLSLDAKKSIRPGIKTN